MRVHKIKKKNGGTRVIYCPNAAEKAALRKLLPSLSAKVKAACPDNCHGFIPGRSPVTNARSHVNFQYTTCFDLKDFFDNIRPEQVDGLSEQERDACFFRGAPRQGLPTSPAIANIAAAKLDAAILKAIPAGIAYTRYADDLSFSYNNPETTKSLLDLIPVLVRECGFTLNEKKTRTACTRHGRRIITGVGVDSQIHPTRKQKRRLRAALHNGNGPAARGLAAWIDYLKEQGWTLTDMEKLVSDIFGKRLKADRKAVSFDGEGGFYNN